MELLGRTEPDEWQIVDDLYPSLRRFAAVAAPSDLDPDDLLFMSASNDAEVTLHVDLP